HAALRDAHARRGVGCCGLTSPHRSVRDLRPSWANQAVEEVPMQVGMVGLGRMGANMVRRLMRGGHECVVHNRSRGPIEARVREGGGGAFGVEEVVGGVGTRRVVWLMVPAGVVDATLAELVPRLADGDVVVDGGNSYYRDDIDRAKRLAARRIHYVDSGTSGG